MADVALCAGWQLLSSRRQLVQYPGVHVARQQGIGWHKVGRRSDRCSSNRLATQVAEVKVLGSRRIFLICKQLSDHPPG
jgi:hypothetical protein